MSAASVTTPVSQAIAAGKLSRGELKAFMQRSNALASLHLSAWIALTLATGGLVWAAENTAWFVPAMFVHGVVLVHYFSLQHECTHYTVFRSRRLNEWAGAVCGLLIGLAPKFFRYEHCDHHTWTQLPGKDPERIPLPASMAGYIWYVSSIPYWWSKLKELTRHAGGRLSDEDKAFVPRVEFAAVITEARILVSIYLAVWLCMVVFQWWDPFWYWFLPVALGEPVMRYIRMTEHVGRPSIADMRVNTRTNLVAAPLRWLCWNMNYHAEHHYASSVPYHALPRLHQRLSGELYCEPHGYFGAHRQIIKKIRRNSQRPAAEGRTQREAQAADGTSE